MTGPQSCIHSSIPAITRSIWLLDNQLVFYDGCSVLCNMPAVPNVPCQLPTIKVNGETGRWVQIAPTAFSLTHLPCTPQCLWCLLAPLTHGLVCLGLPHFPIWIHTHRNTHLLYLYLSICINLYLSIYPYTVHTYTCLSV